MREHHSVIRWLTGLVAAALLCLIALPPAVTAFLEEPPGPAVPLGPAQPASASDALPDGGASPSDAVPGEEASPSDIVISTPEPAPEGPAVVLSRDGTSARFVGDITGLYIRIALVLDMDGVSGLYVMQGALNENGLAVIPAFALPGFTVRGVSVVLTRSLEDLSSGTPTPVASDFVTFP